MRTLFFMSLVGILCINYAFSETRFIIKYKNIHTPYKYNHENLQQMDIQSLNNELHQIDNSAKVINNSAITNDGMYLIIIDKDLTATEKKHFMHLITKNKHVKYIEEDELLEND